MCVAAQSGAAGSSCWLSGGVRTQEVCLVFVCLYLSVNCDNELEDRQSHLGLAKDDGFPSIWVIFAVFLRWGHNIW